jgi:hypothetical protein
MAVIVMFPQAGLAGSTGTMDQINSLLKYNSYTSPNIEKLTSF